MITSLSTLAEVKAAYVDNASYSEDGSVAKARAFVTACRVLLLKLPAEAGTRDSHVRLSPELISREMREAQAWVSSQGLSVAGSTAGRSIRVSFENCR